VVTGGGGRLQDKMSLFQTALDFLAGPGSSGGAGRDQNDFVGQAVEMGDIKLRIKRVIAEGELRSVAPALADDTASGHSTRSLQLAKQARATLAIPHTPTPLLYWPVCGQKKRVIS